MVNRRLVAEIVKFFSGLVVAMIFMIWGTMNMVTNAMDMMRGNPDREWTIGLIFSCFFGLIPFLIGVWLAIRLMRQKNRSMPVAETSEASKVANQIDTDS